MLSPCLGHVHHLRVLLTSGQYALRVYSYIDPLINIYMNFDDDDDDDDDDEGEQGNKNREVEHSRGRSSFQTTTSRGYGLSDVLLTN